MGYRRYSRYCGDQNVGETSFFYKIVCMGKNYLFLEFFDKNLSGNVRIYVAKLYKTFEKY